MFSKKPPNKGQIEIGILLAKTTDACIIEVGSHASFTSREIVNSVAAYN